jgi:hypothetical protein
VVSTDGGLRAGSISGLCVHFYREGAAGCILVRVIIQSALDRETYLQHRRHR